MKKILLLCLVFGTTFFISANTFADGKKISGEGVIVKVYTGIYYTGLVEHQLVKIKSDKNKNFKVLIPTLTSQIYGQKNVILGQKLKFKGILDNFENREIVNTVNGYLYFSDKKTLAEQANFAIQKAQQEAAENEAKGIPNAIPSIIVQTAEQKQKSLRKRYIDVSLAVFGIVVTIMVFYRFSILIKIWYFIRKIYKKIKPTKK